MPIPIVIDLAGVELAGELMDSPGGRALGAVLPCGWECSRWGQEYYGRLDKSPQAAGGRLQRVMAVGGLAYHAESGWFCLFFGPTPASDGEAPVAALEVLKVGQVQGDWQAVDALGDPISATLRLA